MESRGTVVLYCQIQFACVQIRHTPLSGGYCGEVPPLPIPNREVKLTCADGTAMQCGRVGSRLLLSGASITKVVEAFLFSRGFVFFPQISQMYTDFSSAALSFYLFTLFLFYLSFIAEWQLLLSNFFLRVVLCRKVSKNDKNASKSNNF